jgi:threonylcarbamoyladenosine tRNA methylthiotransferase MtaB
MGSKHTAGVLNLGCRVNRVELDAVVRELKSNGVEIVDPHEAHYVVVNTCAVTAEAEAKARKAVRRAAHQPGCKAVVATGCVANLFASELADLAENVVVVPDKSKVAEAILDEMRAAGFEPVSHASTAHGADEPEERVRPGIKIQDGCDNQCTYCIVWKARGHATSMDADRVVAEVAARVAEGAKEVVLTGINLGRWEQDGHDITWLLGKILAETDIERVRLSSIEPTEVTRELLELMRDSNDRVAHFLHLPLQAGSDKTLRAMGRNYDRAFYRRVVETAYEIVPDIAIAADVIVGFPGETDEDFEESFEFCRDMRYSHIHVFRYSRRPGTPAAERDDQVAPETKALRSERLRALSKEMRAARAGELLGTKRRVVVERKGRGTDTGLFDVLLDETLEPGGMVEVTIDATVGTGLLKGTVCP